MPPAKRRATDRFDVALWLKIGVLILAAGMWLGALQMQVSQLQKDHDFHYGKER